jgi:hypothetical protein
MPASKPPKHLGAAGGALWGSIAPKYLLRPDEQARLDAACKVADTLQMLEDTWQSLGYPMVSVGSMRQEVIHPLIGEIRTQRSALASLLAGLKLPDDESGEVPVNQQRAAANSKWATGRGRGA